MPDVTGLDLRFPRYDLSLESRRATKNAIVYDAAAAVREAGLTVSAVVLTPWPADPSPMERSNRETIERLGSVGVETLPLLDLSDPDSWPGLRIQVDSPRATSSLRAA